MGDIGCYTLGALPPLLALDSCLCMGASIGMMAGFNAALGRKAAAAVIGDSTFFHSGVTPLIDAVYNGAEGLVAILDNRTTAMTGHQGHPGTGVRADRSDGHAVDIQRLCEGIGVRCVTVDANDFAALDEAVATEAERPGLGVVVALAPCVLTTRVAAGAVVVDEERCNLCGRCLELGCPALAPGEEAMTTTAACTGCGLCVEVCRRGVLSCADAVGAGEGAR
jgi:indolepyruvate ferredoxin oxidoreductase alpha subunit